MNRKSILIASAVGVALIAVYYFTIAPSADKGGITVPVQEGEFIVDITTTGELEAKNSVEILGPQGTRNFRIWNMTIQDILDEGTVVEKGDYVSIPKGVTYRLSIQEPSYLLRFESFTDRFQKPETGLLGQQALYHEENIQSPLFRLEFEREKNSVIRVQSAGRLTEITYPYDIRELSGWCGSLYPFVLSIHDIAPAMSPMAHLPPSINSTFVCKNFVVCSFVPRPLEEPEGALKVPFYHSNIDYDEVIFYHDGDFFSRDNMGAGYFTLHPRGIHHGPHPKAIKNQHSLKRTNEIAVMLDTVRPLQVSRVLQDVEIKDYWKSWMGD